MTDQQFIHDWARRLREEIPDAVVVMLKGSHARAEPGPFSDLDFDVIVDREATEEYLAWFEETGSDHLRHISVAVQDIDGWLADAGQPVSWAYGLPAAETTLLLWASNESIRQQFDHPARVHPPEEPELEDFIEAWGKACNAASRGDDLAMRLATVKLARLCPGLLRPINPEVFPSNRRKAMHAILDLPIAPERYRDDLLVCMGLSGKATSITTLHQAARRLTFGILGLLRDHAGTFVSLLPDDLYGYLLDGTLERYVRQVDNAGKHS